MLSTNRILRLLLLAAPVLALAVAALVLVFGPGSGNKAQADFPHPGLDFSLGVAAEGCDSSSGSNTCTTDPGQTVTVDFKLNTLPGDLTYDGYDATLNYTGLTVDASPASLVQAGAGVWPGCAFPASFTVPGQLAAGCARGIGGTPSNYTGVLFHVNFTCPSPAPASLAIITLPAGDGNTALTDDASVTHGESVDEMLIVTCGSTGPLPPTLTPTPTWMPPTPGPTSTPTPTPSCAVWGDVSQDGRVNSVDAAVILQFEARLVRWLRCRDRADVSGDGQVNAIDAILILQCEALFYSCATLPL